MALVASIIFYKGLKAYKINRFVWAMALVVLIELASANKDFFKLTSNYFIYNLFVLTSTPIYFYLFYYLLGISDKFRRVYLMIAAFVSVAFLYNFFFFEGISNFNTLSIVFQQFCFILLSCFLLFRMAMSEKYFLLHRHPYFWIAAGILIFSLGTMVVLGMNQFIRLNNITIANKALYGIIMPILNVLLYSSYSYAFYLCERTKKSYSPL